jgi:hypothetical protein
VILNSFNNRHGGFILGEIAQNFTFVHDQDTVCEETTHSTGQRPAIIH